MTGTERMTVDRVLTEIINMRRDVNVEIGVLRAESSGHFERIEQHLTNQDDRLRVVEVVTSRQQALDDARHQDAIESRVSKRWIIGLGVSIVIATVSSIVAVVGMALPGH